MANADTHGNEFLIFPKDKNGAVLTKGEDHKNWDSLWKVCKVVSKVPNCDCSGMMCVGGREEAERNLSQCCLMNKNNFSLQ